MKWGRTRRVAVGTVLIVLFAPAAARAHSDFDYSDPEDGVSIDLPVDEIVVAFTDPVTIVGAGFEVLDPQGNIVEPTVDSDDDMVFLLVLDKPLLGGDAGVRYEVSSSDGHVLSGGFSFTVTAQATTTTVPGTTTTEVVPSTTDAPSSTTSPAATTTIAVLPIVDTSEDTGGWTTPVVIIVAVGVVFAGVGLYRVIRSRSAGG